MVYSKSDVLIVGSGVIGLSCAYELSKRGINVTLIDKAQPGMGCSYGNAGWLTPCFALPLPMPGLLLKSLKWLTDPLSPLHIQAEPSFLFLRFLWRFLRSMKMQTAKRSITALTELSKYSLNIYEHLEKETGFPISFRKNGLILAAHTQEGTLSALQEMRLVEEHGIPGKYLNQEELKALEPALTGPFQGAVYFPNEAHCEPFQVVQAFAQAATRNGVKIIAPAEAFDFDIQNREIRSVRTTRGHFQAKQFVLATGSWSHPIARQLNLNLPILGGKGYALIVKPFDPSPQIPIMVIEKKLAITPRQNSVRLAGTLELVNQDYSISPRRVDALILSAQQSMNVPREPEILELWRGLRPCTPDGVPIIGFSKHHPNLLIATGHQMLGLQSAPGTARLATELLLGLQPSFDPNPFRADRF